MLGDEVPPRLGWGIGVWRRRGCAGVLLDRDGVVVRCFGAETRFSWDALGQGMGFHKRLWSWDNVFMGCLGAGTGFS